MRRREEEGKTRRKYTHTAIESENKKKKKLYSVIGIGIGMLKRCKKDKIYIEKYVNVSLFVCLFFCFVESRDRPFILDLIAHIHVLIDFPSYTFNSIRFSSFN